MSKVRSQSLHLAIREQFTSPNVLLYQDMGSTILYSSSPADITALGYNFSNVTGLNIHTMSKEQLVWSLDNSDRSISVLALYNSISGNQVKCWLWYEGDTVLQFDGVMDEWQTKGQRVMFRATPAAIRSVRFPIDQVEFGTLNHVPAPGTVIRWGQQSIIIEAEQV